MIVLTATMKDDPPLLPGDVPVDFYSNKPNIGLVKAYQKLWEEYHDEDVQIYAHDDLEIFDPDWPVRILGVFTDPKVAIVGLGGAIGIGVAEIYKRPFRTEQLMRLEYRSNSQDWEVHGRHETGERQVAVVDGFFMAIRGSFLQEVEGWKWIQSNFHCYDTAMCLEACRRNWKVKMVGVSCMHHGGATSTSPAYLEWCQEQGSTPEEEHLRPHQWLYDRYRDLLPLRIEEDHE